MDMEQLQSGFGLKLKILKWLIGKRAGDCGADVHRLEYCWWEHRLVLRVICTFQGKAQTELHPSNIKPFQVKLQQNIVIAGVLVVHYDGQGLLLDHLYLSALLSR